MATNNTYKAKYFSACVIHGVALLASQGIDSILGYLVAMLRRTGRGECSMSYLPQHSQMMCMVWRDPLLLPNVARPRLLEPSFLCGFI